MHIDELKDSKFLTKHDVEPELTVTITGLKKEDLSRDNEPPEYKYVLQFKEAKPLILNPTNGQLAAMALGSTETDDWIGKQVTLFNDKTVSFGGKLTGGIRIKPDAPSGKPAAKDDNFDDDIPF